MTYRRAPLRGGSWNNGSNAGLGALNLNNSPANRNSNIGLRRSAIARLEKKVAALHEQYSAGIVDFKTVRLAMASSIAHASKANSNGILSKILEKPFVRKSA